MSTYNEANLEVVKLLREITLKKCHVRLWVSLWDSKSPFKRWFLAEVKHNYTFLRSSGSHKRSLSIQSSWYDLNNEAVKSKGLVCMIWFHPHSSHACKKNLTSTVPKESKNEEFSMNTFSARAAHHPSTSFYQFKVLIAAFEKLGIPISSKIIER